MRDLMRFNHLPIYNLKAVLKETGLKAELLRAWERRYHIPAPQRTTGGHRLYSDYDIALIKWLHARQSEGMSISNAVELWKEISESGRDLLSEYSPEIFPNEINLAENPSQIDSLRQGWLKACMAFDPFNAGAIINRAFSIYPVETVCSDLLQKGLSEIGELWYQGKATVQQEHFASNLAMRRIETLIAASPNPTRNQTLLLACPAEEWHTFPILMLNLTMRRKGVNVVYLGANTPLEQLEQTASIVHPDAVVLSAQQLPAAANVKKAALIFKKMNIPCTFGGRIFNCIPELRTKISGVFLGESLNDATSQLDKVFLHQETVPTIIEDDLLDVSNLFQSRLILIKVRVLEMFLQHGMNTEYLNEINDFFSSSLSAALILGDPAFLKYDLDWIRKLLEDRNRSDHLIPYLNVYAKSIDLEMGSKGSLISNWLTSYVKQISG